jgi:hypothetical protein
VSGTGVDTTFVALTACGTLLASAIIVVRANAIGATPGRDPG